MSQRSAPDPPAQPAAGEPEPETEDSRADPLGTGRKWRLPGLARLRLDRNRPTTIVAIGAAVSVIAASVVVGIGAAGADTDLSDVGAWLPSGSKNLVVHVNGLTGQVDARITLPGGQKPTSLQVSQDGKTVLVLDERTGQVSRIDPSQLTVAQTSTDGTPNQEIVTGGGNAWRVTPGKGEVQRIDPKPAGNAPNGFGAFALMGEAIVFDDGHGGRLPFGKTQADADGTLWVPISASGEVIPIRGSERGAPIKVAEPGHPLTLTLAKGVSSSSAGGRVADRIVVTDVTAGKAMMLTATGIGSTVRLPMELSKGTPDRFLTPGVSEGALVPFLASDNGTLALVDINSGAVQAVPLQAEKHTYGSPLVLGAKVYIPDFDTGSLLVYNSSQAKFEEQIKVTGVKGKLEAYVRNGRLWVNDQNNADAAVVDMQGRIHRIGKDGEPGTGGVPGDQATPAQSQAPAGGQSPSTPPSTPPTDEQRPGQGEAPPREVPRDDPEPSDGDDSKPKPSKPKAPEPDPQPSAPKTGQVPVPTQTITVTATPPVEVPVPSKSETSGSSLPTRSTSSASSSSSGSPGPTGTAGSTKTASPTEPAPGTGTASPPKTDPPTKEAPGTPKATSSDGKIILTFTPSKGAKPTRYRLGNLTAGLSVSPDSIKPDGTMKFTVSGGTCGTEYKFFVSAEFPGEIKNSGYSTPIQPCVKPPKPEGLKISVASGGHGATLTWTAPKGTTDKVTYQVKIADKTYSVPSGTTYVATKLKNSAKYPVTVTAKNAAGSGSVTGTIDLTPPSKTYKVGPNRNNSIGIGIHAGPRVDASTRRGEIDSSYTGNVTVKCQMMGSTETRTATNVTSAVWDLIVYTGPGKSATGYTSDLYIRTPNTNKGTFSPTLWQCE
ncbi:fibronectin type III domain-containing protein [Embleya sp. NBC_00896]|uniref:fibronectin type III domain-containing protein n=1 Tax=Embleya sp. NBC_00896 TaxID=2975961 RepID=UPI0038660B2F|nr:fibronectin type III domain-containing protein [Embleya sp. NBC_00896]